MEETMQAVFATFPERNELKRALDELRRAGVKMRDVTALVPPARGRKDFPYLLRMKVGKGAKIGTWVGFLLGLTAAIVIPSFRPAGRVGLTSGEWLDTVKLLLVVAAPAYLAIFGFICGTLVGIGTPEAASERYSLYLENGGILLSIQCSPDELPAEKLSEILENSGGEDVSKEDAIGVWREITSDPRRISGARWLRVEDDKDANLT